MDSQPFDPSCDPFLGFTSEIPIVPTQDSEPAFMRAPTQAPPQRVGVLLVATPSVVVGLLGGFAAGFAFAHRLILPADASTPLRVVSANSQTPRDDRPMEAARGPNVVAPALPTDES